MADQYAREFVAPRLTEQIRSWKPVGDVRFVVKAPDGRVYWVERAPAKQIEWLIVMKHTPRDILGPQDRNLRKYVPSRESIPHITSLADFDRAFGTDLERLFDEKRPKPRAVR
jgi:hypothetical protein